MKRGQLKRLGLLSCLHASLVASLVFAGGIYWFYQNSDVVLLDSVIIFLQMIAPLFCIAYLTQIANEFLSRNSGTRVIVLGIPIYLVISFFAFILTVLSIVGMIWLANTADIVEQVNDSQQYLKLTVSLLRTPFLLAIAVGLITYLLMRGISGTGMGGISGTGID